LVGLVLVHQVDEHTDADTDDRLHLVAVFRSPMLGMNGTAERRGKTGGFRRAGRQSGWPTFARQIWGVPVQVDAVRPPSPDRLDSPNSQTAEFGQGEVVVDWMLYRCVSVRKRIALPTTAGVANTVPSSWLSANRVQVLPG
jgi:hypothetical protein